MKPLLALLLALGIAAPAGAADTAPRVRIYRCVGSNGAVALQDAPCTRGQQQVIDMQRPQDPPPRRVSTDDLPAPAPAPPPQQAPREIRIIQTPAPQPMYECVTEDGQRYTSDTPDGNPRWVPTWTYAYAGGRPRPPGPRPPSSNGGPPDGGHRPPPGPRPGGAVIVPYGSVQIRDECHALPQREVCARLSDRRWDIIRRYNSALQSEREQLAREQRGIDARLEQDCGGT